MSADDLLWWPRRHRRAWVWICWGVLAANVAVFVWGLIQGTRLWLAGLGVVVSYYAVRAAEKLADDQS